MLKLTAPEDGLFAVRVRYKDSLYYIIDETIALATTDREVGEAVRKWYRKHKEDEGGLTRSNVESAKKYDVYFDKIEADGTVDRGDFRKDVEFTIYDKLV